MNIHPDIAELERIHSLTAKPETSTETLLRWSEDDLTCSRMEVAALRKLAVERDAWRQELWFSRNNWRLATMFAGAMFVLALVMR